MREICTMKEQVVDNYMSYYCFGITASFLRFHILLREFPFYIDILIFINANRPPLWSSGQSS
jgi:hypothetical protein